MKLLKNFPEPVKEALPKDLAADTPLELWFQDEMRIGQKNTLTYLWAPKGTRPRQPADQRYANAYIFGAVCPERGTGAALVMPYCDTKAMEKHLHEISKEIRLSAHGVVLVDRAAWHTTKKLKWPTNITLIELPPRSPELNPQENIWQYMRQNWLANRVFETYEEIVEAACQAWNRLMKTPQTITSIATREWAKVDGC